MTLLADSSSYTYNRYEWSEKNGRWERCRLKHHVLPALNGCVVSSVVTDGNCDDSPMLMRLTETAPFGDRYLLADRTYRCEKSCHEAVGIGGLPCIRPRKSHTGQVSGAWMYMFRWEKNNPGNFKKFGMRKPVENGRFRH